MSKIKLEGLYLALPYFESLDNLKKKMLDIKFNIINLYHPNIISTK